ncbi:MAG: T9SS type A sorting domain-containing protein, partial [Chitinophagaceae bacterium]
NLQAKEAATLTGKTAVIYSKTGSIVLTFKLLSNKVSITVQRLLPGLYILKIGEASDQQVFKMIKM